MHNEPIWELQESAIKRPKLTLGQIRTRIVNMYRDGLWDAAEAMNYISDRNLWPISDADWEGPWGKFVSEIYNLCEPDDPPPSEPVSGAIPTGASSYDRRAA